MLTRAIRGYFRVPGADESVAVIEAIGLLEAFNPLISWWDRTSRRRRGEAFREPALPTDRRTESGLELSHECVGRIAEVEAAKPTHAEHEIQGRRVARLCCGSWLEGAHDEDIWRQPERLADRRGQPRLQSGEWESMGGVEVGPCGLGGRSPFAIDDQISTV